MRQEARQRSRERERAAGDRERAARDRERAGDGSFGGGQGQGGGGGGASGLVAAGGGGDCGGGIVPLAARATRRACPFVPRMPATPPEHIPSVEEQLRGFRQRWLIEQLRVSRQQQLQQQQQQQQQDQPRLVRWKPGLLEGFGNAPIEVSEVTRPPMPPASTRRREAPEPAPEPDVDDVDAEGLRQGARRARTD